MKKTGRRLTLNRSSIKVLEAAHVRRAIGGAETDEDPVSSETKTALPTLHEGCAATVGPTRRYTQCTCDAACAPLG